MAGELLSITLPGGITVPVGGSPPKLELQDALGNALTETDVSTPLRVSLTGTIPQALYGLPVTFKVGGVDSGLSVSAAALRARTDVDLSGLPPGDLVAHLTDGTTKLSSSAVKLIPLPLSTGPYDPVEYDTGTGVTQIELTATGGYPPYSFENPTTGVIHNDGTVGFLQIDLANSFNGYVWFDVVDSKGTRVEANIEVSITGPEAVLLNDPDDVGYSIEVYGLPSTAPTKAAHYLKMVLPSTYAPGEDVSSFGPGLVLKHQGGRFNVFAAYGGQTVHNAAIGDVVFDDLEHEIFLSADGDAGTLQLYVDGIEFLNLTGLTTGSIQALVSSSTDFFEANAGTLEVTRIAAWRDVAPDLSVEANRIAMAAHNEAASVGGAIAMNIWGTRASDFSEKSGASNMTLNVSLADPGAAPLVIQDADGSRIEVDGLSEDVLSYTITFNGGPYAGTYTVLKADLNKGPRFLLPVPIVTGDLTIGSFRTVDPGPVVSYYNVTMVVPTVRRGAVVVGDGFTYTVGEDDDVYGVTVVLTASDPLGQSSSGIGDMVPIAAYPYQTNVFSGDDRISFAQPISANTEKSLLFFARFTTNVAENYTFLSFGAVSKAVMAGTNSLRIITPGWSGEACGKPAPGELCDVIMSFGPNGRQIARKFGSATEWTFDRDLGGMSSSLGMNANPSCRIGAESNGNSPFNGTIERMTMMFGVNPNLKLEASRLMFVTVRDELAPPELVGLEMGASAAIDFYDGANHGTLGAGTVTGTFA